jgi:tetratricopeptide (TPR) repeat protein
MKTLPYLGAAAAIALLLPASPLFAANTLFKVDGSKIAARSIRWNSANREYLVQPMTGGDVTIPIAQKDVARLEIDMPAEMTQAKQLIDANRTLDAIAPLQAVIANYGMLVWDVTAREWLARIYVQAREPVKVIQIVDELLAVDGGKSISPGLRQSYWAALIDSGQSPKAAKDIGEAIAAGPRELVAAAQVMRGNLRLKAGNKEDALEDYLRTILFFEKAPPAIRTEAITQAVAILEGMGDTVRANELRKKSQQ